MSAERAFVVQILGCGMGPGPAPPLRNPHPHPPGRRRWHVLATAALPQAAAWGPGPSGEPPAPPPLFSLSLLASGLWAGKMA